ncbi:MAG TPA: D-TA family PLP-dependent enzyme [Chloroflexota bacterium]|nr:D-TA family PLP-dependent enzyme [Chloroflexota bacterium]
MGATRAADLDTPVVTIDLDLMERTIRRTQDYYDQHGIAFRPHIKTHKIPAIAHLQVGAGARGITCQKLGEAEVFLAAGLRDILIPYNIVGEEKVARLCRLARQASSGNEPGQITVSVDSATAAEGISRGANRAGVEIGMEVECDTGMRRAGVQSPQEAADLAALIARLPGLRFRGWMTYPTGAETVPFFQEATRLTEAGGLTVEVRSGGGTPAMWRAHEALPVVNEYRAGTYVYFDRNSVGAGAATWDECAMRVHMTVVSRPTKDRAILDGGSKTLSSDPAGPGQEGFGRIVEYPDAVIAGQSEEHGHVDLSACPPERRPEIGERVTVIPNHCCVTTNLHDEVVGVRGGAVEIVWPVLARGKVR